MDETQKRRHQYLLRTWGVTLAEYEEVLAYQGGGCIGCGRPGRTRALHVEHDHKTGFLRAIACARCNSALQKVGDDPAILIRLAAMLKDPPFPKVLGRQQVAVSPPKRRRRTRRRK